jgi:hypothetical protein
MSKSKQNKLIKYKQSEWGGIVCGIDPTDIPEKNCLDCQNLDLSIEGQLTSMGGSEKQFSTGLGSTIDEICQIRKEGSLTNFVVYGGIIYKL